MMTQNRPQPGEYAPFYEKYVALVPQENISGILETQLRETQQLLGGLAGHKADFRYAPDKWSIKELLGHINDAERIFSYRLLRIARGDQTPLPGFEQDDYVKTANCSDQKLSGLLEEFISVRRATITLVRSLETASWLRRGISSNAPITALALGFVLVGHVTHHQKILEQRYLPVLAAA